MNNRVKTVLQGILAKFESGDIPKAIAFSMFPIPEIPSAKWSLVNRMLMHMAKTRDARGIRQWNQAGRRVKKGAKAIYILVPWFVTEKDEEKDEEIRMLRGFMGKPVFRAEDTEGEPLDYEKELAIPEFPLMERAREWNIQVTGFDGHLGAYGVYSGDEKTIYLATAEETIFFHELSHAAYEKAIGKFKEERLWAEEIVAELSAQALCILVGKRANDTLGNSYRYVERFAKAAGLSPITACLKVIDDVEKVLSLILGKENRESQKKGAGKSRAGRDTNGKVNLERGRV